jgi:hypothetical protein
MCATSSVFRPSSRCGSVVSEGSYVSLCCVSRPISMPLLASSREGLLELAGPLSDMRATTAMIRRVSTTAAHSLWARAAQVTCISSVALFIARSKPARNHVFPSELPFCLLVPITKSFNDTHYAKLANHAADAFRAPGSTAQCFFGSFPIRTYAASPMPLPKLKL